MRTLYPAFPHERQPLADVFEDYLAERVEPALRRAAADPDPRSALTTTLTSHRRVRRAPDDVRPVRRGPTADITTRYLGPLTEVLSRAEEAGVACRANIVPRTFPA